VVNIVVSGVWSSSEGDGLDVDSSGQSDHPGLGDARIKRLSTRDQLEWQKRSSQSWWLKKTERMDREPKGVLRSNFHCNSFIDYIYPQPLQTNVVPRQSAHTPEATGPPSAPGTEFSSSSSNGDDDGVHQLSPLKFPIR
jgi:hypothetical protein